MIFIPVAIAGFGAFGSVCDLIKTVIEKFFPAKEGAHIRKWSKRTMRRASEWSEDRIHKIKHKRGMVQ